MPEAMAKENVSGCTRKLEARQDTEPLECEPSCSAEAIGVVHVAAMKTRGLAAAVASTFRKHWRALSAEGTKLSLHSK